MKHLILYMYISFCYSAQAQKQWNIYLGSGGHSFFSYHVNNLNTDLTYPLPEIGDYSAFYHYGVDTIGDYTNNRIGLLLPAKSTTRYDKTAQAAFGKGNDTCFIRYQSKVIKVTHGRSAAQSIINLFSKEENKNYQADPYDVIRHVWVQGTLEVKNTFFDFLFDYSLKNKFIPSGWMILHGDTLRIEPVSLLVKEGRIKKSNAAYRIGMLLKKGEQVYGGIDAYRKESVVYILNTVGDEEKLGILSCFFIIACFG
jgi:hypothetical protein